MGQEDEPRNTQTSGRRRIDTLRKATSSTAHSQAVRESCAVKDPGTQGSILPEAERSRVLPWHAIADGTRGEV
jgi:hypothetical protein